MKSRVWKNAAQFLAAVLFLVGVWLVAYSIAGNELIVPSFFDSLKEVGRLLADGAFWNAFFKTLLRVFAAFIPCFIFALIFALISYLYPVFQGFFSPIISVIRSTPTMAVVLIILVWAGAGRSPMIVAALSLFPVLYTGISAAFSGIDPKLLEMSRVYRVPLKTQICKLYLPTLAPFVAKESGAALAFGLKLVVSAEVLVRTAVSLGGMMQDAKLDTEIPTLFALVTVTAVVGILLECLGSLFARLFSGGAK
jgi:NitT/TauT family transport system permease protein